jgi:hypothetical protein
MHAVCGYPVKSTWFKAIKAGNYVGWPMITEHNVQKYYPEAPEIAKGHLNQTQKNLCSNKEKPAPLETCNTLQLKGKKARNVYTETYNVRKTMFLDQTGQFPMRSQQGNKYIMVMVKIDSNAILVEPMKSCKDAEMIQAYDALLLRLKRAGIVPKKHVLDNKVSENMKNHIRDKCKFDMELVPPGCHQRNTAEVAIRNLKPIFSVYSQAYPTTFPLAYGTGYSHKQKSLSTSYANLMPPPPYQHTRISVDPLTTAKCCSHRWDAMLKSMRKPTNAAHGHFIR